MTQMVRNPPPIQETWIPSLGWEDLLEKGMATHSSILAWEIPWTEEPGRLQSMGCKPVLWKGSGSSRPSSRCISDCWFVIIEIKNDKSFPQGYKGNSCNFLTWKTGVEILCPF